MYLNYTCSKIWISTWFSFFNFIFPGGDHQHKVRFDQNEENNAISVERQIEPENSFIVHLGFLKINHYYAIEFPILKYVLILFI